MNFIDLQHLTSSLSIIGDKVDGYKVVAVTGHTNAGKTTFVRALVENFEGIIEDKANTTKYIQIAKNNEEKIIFLDCPGFQNARVLEQYLQIHQDKMLSDFLKQSFAEKLVYDIRTIEAVERSHAVLYLASLETVPDDSFTSEIEIISKLQPNILGLVTKFTLLTAGFPRETLEKRTKLWNDVMASAGVKTIEPYVHETQNLYVTTKQVYQNLKSLL